MSVSKNWLKSFLLIGVLGGAVVYPSPSLATDLSSLFGKIKNESKFLPVTEAFNVQAVQLDDELVLTFRVRSGYYLYKQRLSLDLPPQITAGEWTFDKEPIIIDDPNFGTVPVFDGDVVARIKLTSTAAVDNQSIGIRWQGCAKAGLCYPPELIALPVSLPASDAPTRAKQSALPPKTQSQSTITSPNQPTPPVAGILPATDNLGDNQSANNQLDDQTAVQDSQTAKYPLNHRLPDDSSSDDKSHLVMIALLFLAGLLLAFTPCIYPMLPIVANIVARQHAKANAKYGFILSLSYAFGVASAYGILGVLIAWFGQALGIGSWLQRTEVLIVAVMLFVIFALMMFGWLQFRLPASIANKLTNNARWADRWLGTVGGSYLSGLLSALVVSPCVSAPMAGALTMVAANGNLLFGFVALFALGFGLSIPLIIVGSLQGKWLPKAGAWMQHIRTLGGFLLLGVALFLTERLLVSPAMLLLWAIWFVALAIWLAIALGSWLRLLAVVPMAWAGLLIYGATLGAIDAWRPWQKPVQTAVANQDIRVYDLAELDKILASHDKVLVDVTADWCVQCRVMERTLFTNRPDELASYQVVKLDITKTNEQSQAILARYQLFGPPALIIYKQGTLQEILLGTTQPEVFKATLAKY